MGLTCQVQQHGLWPTIQQLIRGLQGVPQQHPQGPQRQARRQRQPQQGGRQTRAQRKQRFEEVARAVQALPMEEYVTRQDLERCSLHTLRVRLSYDTHAPIVSVSPTLSSAWWTPSHALSQGAGMLPLLLMQHVSQYVQAPIALQLAFAVCSRDE